MLKTSAKGSSLIEILVAVGMLLLLILFIFQFLVFSYKYTKVADVKINIQTDLRRAQEELSSAIGGATWDKFVGSNISGIYIFGSDPTSAGDYRHAILLQSAVKDDGLLDIDSAGSLKLTKYVLFYIIRPVGDTCFSLSGEPENPDNACYHKLLIRKDLDPAVISTSLTDSTDVWNAISSYVSTVLSVGGNVKKVKTISRDILSFDIQPPTTPGPLKINVNGLEIAVSNPQLSIVLRGFKEAEFRSKLSPSELQDLTSNELYNIRLDTSIAPEN